jgi:hypothetical protein
MNLSDQIQAWLDANGPYTQGVALYRLAGGVRPAKHYEKYLRSAYVPKAQKEALRNDLERYLLLMPPSTAIAAQERSDGFPQHDSEEEPDAVLALRAKARPLHKRYSHLKGELYAESQQDLPSEARLYEIARQIMAETIPALDAIYDQIRTWQQTGEVPPMPRHTIVEQTVEKFNLMHSKRTRISHLKTKLKKTTDPMERAAIEAEIAEKAAIIAELRAELGLEKD